MKTLRPLLAQAAFAIAALFALSACNEDKSKVIAAPSAAKSFSEYFKIGLGDRTPRIQLAIHQAEQQQGLMHRRDLGPDDGMVFIYARPQAMSFWMRNTPSPLDIGFFDENGVLQEVYPLRPFDETPVKSRKPAKYAVEMPRDWYQNNGVKPGAKLDLKALAQALRARGMDPVLQGLRD